MGFFPASHPEVAISVIVDDADAHAPGGVAYGNMVAAPSFKRIGERLIPYLDIQQPVDSNIQRTLASMGGVHIRMIELPDPKPGSPHPRV